MSVRLDVLAPPTPFTDAAGRPSPQVRAELADDAPGRIPPSRDPDLDLVPLEDVGDIANVDVLAVLRAVGDGRLRTFAASVRGEVVQCVRRGDLDKLADGASEADMRAADELLYPGGRRSWGQ